jgi:flagellar biosynthetic protein FliQ
VDDLARDALGLALLVAAPLLLAGLLTAFVVSLFQAATQTVEPSLSFVPKLLAMAAVLALLGNWMGGQLVDFARTLLTGFPGLIE